MTSPASAPAHPSYLALDRASLGVAAAEIVSHLEQCAECRAYIEALRRTPSVGFEPLRTRVARERRGRIARWALALPVAAAICALALVLRPASEETATSGAYVGAKGFLSVWIYVKHGNETTLWDGSTPLVPGDRVRLKLDPRTFRHVQVYSLRDPQKPELLYASDVAPGENVTLPEAWEIDAEPGAEHLAVVFSQSPTKPSWPAWLHGHAPADVSVHSFVLPKVANVPRDAGARTP